MRVIVGSDHAGFGLKALCVEWLREWGHEVEDVGTSSASVRVDYPEFGARVGQRVIALTAQGVAGGEVVRGEVVRGVAICGSGIGVCIAANKVPGIRAALVHEPTSARLAREHNDVNVICFGERVIGVAVAHESLHAFLSAQFAGERHARRIAQLAELEKR
jgi:RpiB/LacA/LacB family sugar-phosphate isomerase